MVQKSWKKHPNIVQKWSQHRSEIDEKIDAKKRLKKSKRFTTISKLKTYTKFD